MQLTRPSSIRQPTCAAWAQLPEDSVLRLWARDLARAHGGVRNRHASAMAGQGVIIEHDDDDEVLALLPALAADAGLAFQRASREAILGGIESVLEQIPDDQPTLLYLEPGRWMVAIEDDDADSYGLPLGVGFDSGEAYRVRATLGDFMDAGLPSSSLVLVTTVSVFRQLDAMLRREGRFDRRLRLPQLSDEAIGGRFLDELGQAVFDLAQPAELPRLGALVRNEFRDTRRRSLLRQALRRRVWRAGRPVSLADVIEFAVHGTAEEDAHARSAADRRVVAVHEAGHVVVGWLDSRDRSAPIYASVNAHGSTEGVVMADCLAHEQSTSDRRRRDIDHEVRRCLAGRAAEWLVLGGDELSVAGAQMDLEAATRTATRLFGRWGQPVDADSDAAAGSNLAVVLGPPDARERARIDELARDYLARQFERTLEILRAHRDLLERVAQALDERGVLFKADIEALAPTGLAPAA